MELKHIQDLSDRVRWLPYQGQDYLIIDFRYCSDQNRIGISRIAVQIISKQEFNSVKLLVDVRHTNISIESLRAVKKDWISMMPFLYRISMIGVTGSKSTMLKLWGFMTSMKIKSVKSEKQGLQFLFS